MKYSKTKHILGAISRTLLAVVFLFSGTVKMIDPQGTLFKIEDYLTAFGEHLAFFKSLLPLAGTAAVLLILVEMLLGVAMLLNIRTRWTSWITLAFYAVMTPLTLYIALTNPVSDCGCFGDALVLTNWQTFYKNVVLIALAIVLVVCRKHIPQLLKWPIELGVMSVALLAALGFMLWTQLHLPVVDFRPYKVGNNLPQLMEGGKAPVYDYIYTYEKDGKQQQFKVSEVPSKDEGWTYVSREDILLEEGVEAPVHDLMIVNRDMYGSEDDYADITYDILESEDKQTLVIMYNIDKSDRKLIDKIAALQAECEPDHFWVVTGSGDEAIRQWLDETGAHKEALSQVICTCDPVTLKTIVRANPGVIEIQNGTVINKYNLRNK